MFGEGFLGGSGSESLVRWQLDDGWRKRVGQASLSAVDSESLLCGLSARASLDS